MAKNIAREFETEFLQKLSSQMKLLRILLSTTERVCKNLKIKKALLEKYFSKTALFLKNIKKIAFFFRKKVSFLLFFCEFFDFLPNVLCVKSVST